VKKVFLMLFLALILPTTLSAAEITAEIKGTILKVDKAENRIVLKTERGEETFETTKATKGIEHIKVGARVTISFTEKDGQPKVTEITPGG
jgi:Cu/Ag efflux protein CusF